MGAEVPWGAGEVGRAKKLLWGGDIRGNPGPQREKREETGAANQGKILRKGQVLYEFISM